MNQDNASGSAARLLPSIFLLLLDVGYIVTAHLTLDAASSRVPLLTAYVTLAFLIWDILRDLLPKARATESADSTTGVTESGPLPAQEAKVLLSVAGLILGIYLVGFYVAIPIYLIAAIRYLGKQSMRAALILTLITCLAIYLTFDLALGYRIYPGIFLS